MLTLNFLGPPEVRLAGRPVDFPTRKALALCIYLAVERRTHTRETLTALFWPESDGERGRGALRRTLAYLREAIGPERLLADRDSLAFNFDTEFKLDLIQVEAAARGEALAWLAAVALYRDDFLAGFTLDDAPDFDNWAATQRELWHQRMATVFDRLSHSLAERGQRTAALETVSRWVAHDSLNEAAHRRLMELHFADGNRAAALRAYEACRALLQHELNIEPEPETRAFADRIRAAEEKGPARNRTASQSAARNALAEPPLVGREAEHLQLVRVYHETRLYQLRLVALEGEPGIGKTRLAREFLNWARTQGADILQGRAFETGGRLPYQPLVEALRSVSLKPLVSGLSPVWLAELARLLPELHDLDPHLPQPLTLNEDEAKGRLYEAVVRLVQAMADRHPITLFVDDLQWADAASLDLLRYAARRWSAAGLPVLILFTIRSEDLGADPTLAQWLFDLGRELALTRLRLGPLSLEEARQLAEALGGADSDRVVAAAGGHPLFIVETVRAGDALPAGIRDLIRSRLSRLNSAALAVCMAASVIGGEVEFETLRRVADLGEGECLSALDELIARGLLRYSNARHTFAHDQIREVAYAEAGETRRRVFHRRALAALASAPAAELVRHAAAADLPGQVFDLSLAAGDAALRLFAVRDAVTHYERALTIKATSHLYSQLGRVYELTNATDKSQAAFEALLRLAREEQDTSTECAALNRLAALASRDLSNLSAAETLLQAALNVAERNDDLTSLADTELNLAQLGIYRTDLAGMQRHGQRALTLAREVGSRELMARALNQLAFAETVWGQLVPAIPHAEEARELYAALGDRPMEADSSCLLSDACVRFGELERGLAAARAAEVISKEIENAWGQANSAIRLGLGLLERGEWGQALKAARTGVEVARRNSITQLLALNLVVLGGVHRALFALDEARAAHEEVVQLATAMHYSYFEETAASELCADYAAAGDSEQALEFARRALTLRHPDILTFTSFSRWRETEVLARVGGADAERAAEDIRIFGELAGGNRRYRIVYLRASAALAQARRETGQANAFLNEAAGLAESLGLPGELWQLYAELGEASRARDVVQSLAAQLDNGRVRDNFLTGAEKRLARS